MGPEEASRVFQINTVNGSISARIPLTEVPETQNVWLVSVPVYFEDRFIFPFSENLFYLWLLVSLFSIFPIQISSFIKLMIERKQKFTSIPIPVNPPPFRGSLQHKSLISRMDWVSCAGDINLPHTPFPPARYPLNKKSSTIKSWPTFCDQYFWKFPIWNSRADEKRREIRMVKVFKWYPIIDLFDTFTGKLGHGD